MLNADLENFTIDQFAGALALSLGAVGSLLLVIWQSKCHCRINLCYLFTCERKPGLPEETKEEDPKKKDKKDKKGDLPGVVNLKDVNTEIEKEPLDSVTSQRSDFTNSDIEVSPPNP